MFPELLRVPWIDHAVPGYGVLLVLGIGIGIWTGVRFAAADGLDRRRVAELALAVVGASLVGSKLLLVVTDPGLLEPERLRTGDLWASAGVYYGGFLAAIAVSIALSRVWTLPWWTVADAFAPAIAIGQAIGRLGCFAAGCCWGARCDRIWAVRFPAEAAIVTGVPAGVPLHPVQLYEAAAVFGIFLVLMGMRRRGVRPGSVLFAYIALYGAARFVVEFWRDDPRGDVLGMSTATGLSTSQAIGVACILIAAAGAAWRRFVPARLRAGPMAEPRNGNPAAAS